MGTVRGLADVAGEALLLAGGGRAILLQIAHPAIGAGVAEHSDFAHRPLERLHGTLAYLYALNYGSADDVRTVRRHVNRAHAPVRAPGYSAFDPTLQLWVAATLYDSAVTVWNAVLRPFDEASADRTYQDWAAVGTALQMPRELWPADRAAFARYWAEAGGDLDVTPEARRVAHDVLHPTTAPIWLRALMPVVRLVTTGLLDERMRTDFGLTWGPARQRTLDALLRITAVVYPRLPRRIRFWPRDALMRELHRGAAPAPAPA